MGSDRDVALSFVRDPDSGLRRGTVLRERTSDCALRYVTADKVLTNAFWNYYLRSEAADVGEPTISGERHG